VLRRLLLGAAAGAAGTTALNATTYLDMVVRGRPPSTTPERTVDRMAGVAHAGIPGDEQQRGNRRTGLGALTGIFTGAAVGAGYAALAGRRTAPTWLGAVLVGGLAMLAADVPLVLLRVSDPRTWSRADWASDVLPHLAYGAVTAATYANLERPRVGRTGRWWTAMRRG
jgi:hypothetical protein